MSLEIKPNLKEIDLNRRLVLSYNEYPRKRNIFFVKLIYLKYFRCYQFYLY